MNKNTVKVTKKYVEDDLDQWLVRLVVNGKKYPRKHGYFYCYPIEISKQSAIENALIDVGKDLLEEEIAGRFEGWQKSIDSERDRINQLRALQIMIDNCDRNIDAIEKISKLAD
jgi:hypothetical protein